MITRTIKSFLLIAAVCCVFTSCSENLLTVESPDGNIKLILDNSNSLTYAVNYQGKEIVEPSLLGLQFKDHDRLDADLRITGSEKRNNDSQWERVWGKNKIVKDQYQELVLHLTNSAEDLMIDVIVRAYNDGIAIRYHIPEQEKIKEFVLIADRTSYKLTGNHKVWAAHYGSFKSHQESEFNEMYLNDPRMNEITGMPLLIDAGEDTWMAITEANLTDWAGMYVKTVAGSENSLETVLSPWPDEPDVLVKSQAPRYSPWRVIMIGDSPGDFIESDIIANLNEPNALDDVSWIKPGKSSWDWWWCNNYSPDVDFEMGSNTETMKHFIDLSAEMGWEYQLVDWHWYGPPFLPTEEDENTSHPDTKLTTMNPDIDIPELVRYGAERGVEILLWLEWTHADKQMEEGFPLYEKWGVAGVKVDFMQRDDQYAVNFYHRLVKLAAKHHLVVDFHGAYKPTGVSRTWPNLMTREGVLGNEYTKWSDRITPEHKVTIPYTRGILGEMDFTPGAFVNVRVEDFKLETESPTPMAMGTRCNQLAMMIVYESALQVLCDAPYNYRSSPAGTDFLSMVPTTWEETKFLGGAVGDYIITARRSGDDWYIGAMSDEEERMFKIALDFLEEGSYTASIWKDAEDADIEPTHLEKVEMEVTSETVIEGSMALGGGQVIYLKKN